MSPASCLPGGVQSDPVIFIYFEDKPSSFWGLATAQRAASTLCVAEAWRVSLPLAVPGRWAAAYRRAAAAAAPAASFSFLLGARRRLPAEVVVRWQQLHTRSPAEPGGGGDLLLLVTPEVHTALKIKPPLPTPWDTMSTPPPRQRIA